MKYAKLSLKINTEIMNRLLNKSLEEFFNLESESLADVDIEDCLRDYTTYLLICHVDIFRIEANK